MVVGYKTYGVPPIPPTQDNFIDIGKYCSIGPGLEFELGNNHDIKAVSTYPHNGARNPKERSIVVGHDVWIGSGVKLFGGTIIGNGAVIGALSRVRGYIPPYAIAYGNPCDVQGYRFGKRNIAALLRIAWWNWDSDTVERNAEHIVSRDVDAFIERFL